MTSTREKASRTPHIHVPFEMVDEYLSFLKEQKVNIEIYFGSKIFDELTVEDISGLKNKLDYNPSYTIHGPFMDLSPGAVDLKVREITMQRFSAALDYAEILKPEVIVFHSGYDKWKYAKRVDIWLEESLKTWRTINRRASDIGVKIAIENIFEDEPGHLKQLADEIGSDNFGLCFDTGHFNMFSKLPLKEWLDLIKKHIKELHIHDNMRYADQHLAIGDGDFDFDTLFKELDDTDCVYTLEAHTVEGVKKSLERLREYGVKEY